MTYLVIMMLTFADGSVFAYDNGKWPTATSMEQCETMIKDWISEMRIQFADSDKHPSTFITGCAQKS